MSPPVTASAFTTMYYKKLISLSKLKQNELAAKYLGIMENWITLAFYFRAS